MNLIKLDEWIYVDPNSIEQITWEESEKYIGDRKAKYGNIIILYKSGHQENVICGEDIKIEHLKKYIEKLTTRASAYRD